MTTRSSVKRRGCCDCRAGRRCCAAKSRTAMRSAHVAAARLDSLSLGELKSIDYNHLQACDRPSVVSLLNFCVAGDDITERTGREIRMKHFQISGQCYVTAGTGVDQIHRVLVVYDRQTNGTALTTADVLSRFFGNLAQDINLAYNLDNRRRFEILYDRKFSLNASGEAFSSRDFKFSRRIDLPVVFNAGVAGTVADIATGSMYIITYGNVAAGATAGSCQFSTRIRFEDS